MIEIPDSKREIKKYKQIVEYEEKTFLIDLGIEFENTLSGAIIARPISIKTREVDLEEKFE